MGNLPLKKPVKHVLLFIIFSKRQRFIYLYLYLMSTKILLTVLVSGLFLCHAQIVTAQYPTEDTTQTSLPGNDKVRKISLSKEPQLTGEQLPASVSNIEVVCAMWDTTYLGFIQVGMGNRRIAAVPDKDLHSYLQGYVSSAFSHLYTTDGMKLLWVIEDIRIAERTGAMSEKAYVRLKATSFGSADGVRYKRLNSIDEVKMNGGMDVTHKHKSNIGNALKTLLQQTPESTDSLFTKEEVLQLFRQKREIPALADKDMKDGIYLNFTEFRENKPSQGQFELQTGRKNSVALAAIGESGQKTLVTKCWGVVKDGEVYKYVNGRLVALEKYNYGYIISSYLDASRRRNRSILWSSALGGVTGLLISSSVTELQKVDAFPLDPRPEATAIDMETGAFIF